MRRPGSDAPAVVFGDSISALAVLRALGRRGVSIMVASDGADLARWSRWCHRASRERLDESTAVEGLAAYLAELPVQRAVLFPCSDRWATTLASLPPAMSATFPAIVPEASVLRTLTDKERFAAVVDEVGIPAPRVVHVSGPGDIGSLHGEDRRRFFLKPVDSQRFAAEFGVKGLRLDDPARARGVAEQALASGHRLMLQELIPGAPTAHVFLDGFVDRAGRMRACLARRRIRMYPAVFGNSTLSETIAIDEVGGALSSLRRLFDALGFTGLFDAEFTVDVRDGQAKVIEVNGRPWWQLELADHCGIDLCGMAYRDALGLPVRSPAGYPLGRTWVHPVPDLKAWWSSRRDPRTAGPPPWRAWTRGANAVSSWDDPLPGVAEALRGVRGAIRAGYQRSAPSWMRPAGVAWTSAQVAPYTVAPPNRR